MSKEDSGFEPSQTQLVEYYKSENFKDYVAERYVISPEHLEAPTIVKMIYALEWYNVPRSNINEMAKYHPYLTEYDFDQLLYLNTQHYIENSITFTLFTLIANRLLYSYGVNKWQKLSWRTVRYPFACAVGMGITAIVNKFMLRPVYYSEFENLGLNKYLTLDLNADMMKNDLKNMGIEVNAKYFDLNEVQSSVDNSANSNK